MRNLKRALSLALASVMLLGMMVVGSSAAFADADKISNDEAVGIAAALGLFAGYEENGVTNFKPEETVTRAQMAAIVAKMYYGSELNADTYKGGNKFNDTASFEGGWAEGYINLGVEKGWFKGYGDGTFKPGQAVTTAEAMPMIINLLGIDAGEGTWPMTVMAAVEEAKLFNDEVELKPAPATNAAITRDQLSVAVVNGLWYSAEGVQGYSYGTNTMVFKTWSDAAEFGKDTYGDDYNAALIAEVKGVVTGNQATGLDYTEFNNGELKLDIETGKDMLGHTVNAMYAKKGEYVNEKNRGTAYGVVDTLEYYTVANDIAGDKKAYNAVFGGKVKEATTVAAYTFDGVENGTLDADAYDKDAFNAIAGTYGVDEESGEIVTYIAPVEFTVGQVGYIKTVAGKETITLNSQVYQNNADLDVIEEYEGVAEDDIVVVTKYQVSEDRTEGKVYIEKLEPAEGKIEAVVNSKLNGKAVQYVTIGGKDYLIPETAITVHGSVEANIVTEYEPHATNTYAVYAYGDTLIGVEQITGAGNLEDAIFVVKAYTVNEKTNYSQDVAHYYVQGVNAKGEEVTVLIGIAGVSEDNGETGVVTQDIFESEEYGLNKFYTFDKSLDREQAKKDVMTATEAYTVEELGEQNGYFAEFADKGEKLSDEDKYLTYGDSTAAANRLYLTENTKFIVVEKPSSTVDELEIATYTGAISKSLADDDLVAVAGVVDANGSKTAELVVVLTANMNLAIEDYIYIAAESTYSITADGYKYSNIYFTETEEFKSGIVTDKVYANGFYEIVDIDEDGVYTLDEAETGLELKDAEAEAVYGNNLILADDDNSMYALAEDAMIYDVRSEETLETAEVGEITSLKGIAAAIKGGYYDVTFDLLFKDIDADTRVITHIFVKDVQ